MLETRHGRWLGSAAFSNPIQLLQFPLPEASHSETELRVQRRTWEGWLSFNQNELNVKNTSFKSFPKYQSIHKHEKQLVIHKASRSSGVMGHIGLAEKMLDVGIVHWLGPIWMDRNHKSPQSWRKWSFKSGRSLLSACRKWQILQIPRTKGTPSVTCKESPCQLGPSEKGRDNWGVPPSFPCQEQLPAQN